MPLVDQPDWVKTVAQRERADLLTAVGQTLAVGGGSLNLDTSGYASIALFWSANIGAVGDKFYLSLTWSSAGNQVEYQAVSLHNFVSYGGAFSSGMFLSLPVRGQSLNAAALGTAAGNPTFRVVGSDRVVQGEDLSFITSAVANRLRLDTGVVAVAGVSTSARFYLRPGRSQLRVHSDSRLATIETHLDAVTWDGAALSAVPLAALSSDGVRPVNEIVEAPLMATELTIVNTAAAAANVRVQVWDVS